MNNDHRQDNFLNPQTQILVLEVEQAHLNQIIERQEQQLKHITEKYVRLYKITFDFCNGIRSKLYLLGGILDDDDEILEIVKNVINEPCTSE